MTSNPAKLYGSVAREELLRYDADLLVWHPIPEQVAQWIQFDHRAIRAYNEILYHDIANHSRAWSLQPAAVHGCLDRDGVAVRNKGDGGT